MCPSESDRVTIATGPVVTTGPNWESIAMLFAKVANWRLATHAVAKDGRHPHGYLFTSYDETARAARDSLEAAGLGFILGTDPPIEESGATLKGVPYTRTTLQVTFVILDPDSGATMTTRHTGTAIDFEDKGTNKALTSALKYWLMRTLLLSTADTDDDPDRLSPMTQEPTNGSQPRPTGTTTELRAALMAFATEQAKNARIDAMSYDEVKAILGVAHLQDYAGDLAQAKRALMVEIASRVHASRDNAAPGK